jgi:hypothetical protein
VTRRVGGGRGGAGAGCGGGGEVGGLVEPGVVADQHLVAADDDGVGVAAGDAAGLEVGQRDGDVVGGPGIGAAGALDLVLVDGGGEGFECEAGGGEDGAAGGGGAGEDQRRAGLDHSAVAGELGGGGDGAWSRRCGTAMRVMAETTRKASEKSARVGPAWSEEGHA